MGSLKSRRRLAEEVTTGAKSPHNNNNPTLEKTMPLTRLLKTLGAINACRKYVCPPKVASGMKVVTNFKIVDMTFNIYIYKCNFNKITIFISSTRAIVSFFIVKHFNSKWWREFREMKIVP